MLSIIIPIYKVEKYIERCARSLMEQTLMDDVEFLFINDCTPDDSMSVLENIIQEYPHRHDQVRIITNKQNLGICETRKQGIREARGEYIGWCDSDDWVEKDMYDVMYTTAKSLELDVVMCDYILEYEDHREIYHGRYGENLTSCLQNLGQWNSFARCLWQHVIKKELLMFAAANIVTANFAEDFYMVVYSYSQALTCKHISNPYYHYNRAVPYSLSTSKNIQRTAKEWEAQRANIERIDKILCSTHNGKKLYKISCNRLKFQTKEEYHSAFEDNKTFYEEFKECYSDIMSYTDIPLLTRIKIRTIYISYWTYYLYLHIK